MELFRSPFSDLETYDRGWQLSAHVGLSEVSLGYRLERHALGEWNLTIMLGPLAFYLWRVKP